MTTQAIALGVGASGALIDVTSLVTGTEGVNYSWGRQSEFRDPAPAQFSFVLDNYDGQFTPGSTTTTLATPLAEGATACWQFGTRLVAGTVSSIGFANSEADWGRITITVSDVFYIANRTPLTGLAASIASAQAYNYWPFSDPAGSGQVLEAFGGPTLISDPNFGPSPWLFGVAATGAAADQQMTMTGTGVSIGTQNVLLHGGPGAIPQAFASTPYPSGSGSAWGLWVTTSTLNDGFGLGVTLGLSGQFSLTLTGGAVPTLSVARANMIQPFTLTVNAPGFTPRVAHYVACAVTNVGTTFTATIYLDGVAIGSQSWTSAAPDARPTGLSLGSTGTVSFSHLTHSPWLLREDLAAVTTEANRFLAIAQTVPGLTLGSVDPVVSTALVDVMSSGGNAWSALCDLIRGEQGYIWVSTSGSLLNPTSVVNVRSRVRPTAVTLTIDAAKDLDGVPQFDRDITNLFGTVTASAPNATASWTDPAAVARAGSASTSETVVFKGSTDLLGYAQDRMIRGENVALKVSKFDINTLVSETVTVAQVLALQPGDRIRIINLPGGPLGFTSWDGWLLGASEVHSLGASAADRFSLYAQPVLPRTAIADTDLVQAGGQLILTSAIAAGNTTMSVTSVDGTLLETVQVPYTLQIDSEQVTVTAVSGSPQTATITRGVNGTTAAAHAANASIDIATPTLTAY